MVHHLPIVMVAVKELGGMIMDGFTSLLIFMGSSIIKKVGALLKNKSQIVLQAKYNYRVSSFSHQDYIIEIQFLQEWDFERKMDNHGFILHENWHKSPLVWYL